MEVEEIDNHTPDGVTHGFTVESVRLHGEATPDIVEVEGADPLLLWPQVHHGVLEQCKVAESAVVALWRSGLDKTETYMDDLYGTVIAFLPDSKFKFLIRHDEAVILCETKRLPVHHKNAFSATAPNVCDVAVALQM